MSFTLRPGAGVAVLAPAGPCAGEAFGAGLRAVASRYTVVRDCSDRQAPPPDLPFLAADDRTRLTHLRRAIEDPRVEAIFCVRGGYGTMRLLRWLPAASLRAAPKPIIGFSDITALLAWANVQGVAAVHGPVLSQVHNLPRHDMDALFGLLEGRPPSPLRGLEPLTRGRARGPLMGGNLTVLCHLLGTPYLPDPTGRILLLEEVNEPPYRIDRMLTHLGLAGVLDRVAGVLVGELSGCDARGPGTVDGVLRDRLGRLDVPVLTGAPVGHGARNLALPLGVPVALSADQGSLTVGTA